MLQNSYYSENGLDIIDITTAGNIDFIRGNVLKYLARAGIKKYGVFEEDLSKAKSYINRLGSADDSLFLSLDVVEKISGMMETYIQRRKENVSTLNATANNIRVYSQVWELLGDIGTKPTTIGDILHRIDNVINFELELKALDMGRHKPTEIREDDDTIVVEYIVESDTVGKILKWSNETRGMRYLGVKVNADGAAVNSDDDYALLIFDGVNVFYNAATSTYTVGFYAVNDTDDDTEETEEE